MLETQNNTKVNNIREYTLTSNPDENIFALKSEPEIELTVSSHTKKNFMPNIRFMFTKFLNEKYDCKVNAA